jgi:hypothetical protein
MIVSLSEETFIVPEKGVSGILNFFYRKDIRNTANDYGISYDQVMESLEKVRKDNPGKKAVITFYQKDNESPGLIVEEKDTYFNRLEEQVNRTGVLIRVPI